jgi:DNA-3-methyladenine glycosylase
MKRLERDFFSRSTLEVAQDLLGKVMILNDYKCIITETEAYIGRDDPACHAARGRTPRTEVMFGPAGVTYVYFIYGMYFCLNFVTEKEGFPAAVLIRGAQLFSPEQKELNGPGKLCRHLNITTTHHNKVDLITSNSFYVSDVGLKAAYIATPRIGIKKGTEKLWRFLSLQKISLPFKG